MKKTLLLTCIIIFYNDCFAQKMGKETLKTISFINNKRIKRNIGLRSCDSCAPIMTIGLRITVDISEKEEEIARQLSYNTWITLLNDPKKDWAANLVLYYIFNKDAVPLYHIKNRRHWIKYVKNEDLRFWQEQLPHD